MSEIKLNSLYIHPDETLVRIDFDEIIEKEDETEEDGISRTKINRVVTAPLRPTKGLLDDVKSLRRHGMAIMGIELKDEAKQIKNWNVQKITLSGDYVTKKSRVVMTLSVYCDLTGKVSTLKVPQVTMYPKNEDQVKYHDADKMTTLIEKIIQKVWNYLDGEQEEEGQFVLFKKLFREPVTV